MNPRFSSSEDSESKAERIGKAVWSELTPHLREKCDRISALLFRRDPLNISIGSNEEDYDEVAWAIVAHLISTPTKEHALVAVHRAFRQIFGEDKTGPMTEYASVAQEIWLMWRSPP